MRKTFSSRKGAVRFFNLLVVLALLLALSPATILAATTTGSVAESKLGKQDRLKLAEALVNGKSTVELLLANKPGTNQSVENQVKALGGKVQYREDEMDYVRVQIALAKAEAVAQINEVESLDVGEVIPFVDPRPDGAGFTNPQTPPGPTTPRNNPYMPINETGAVDFTNAHPKWDGRETKIAIVDSGVDLAHPALQKTTTGERKIVDWVTYTDPLTDGDPTWVDMTGVVVPTGSTVSVGGITYKVPRAAGSGSAASLRLGIFNERDPNLGGEVGNDVNRDGNPAGSNGKFAVLWNMTNGRIWVDTNQNNDFTDEKEMLPYKRRFDIGTFGKDNPATPIVEEMPFVVQTYENAVTNKYFVNIGIPSGAHGSHVAGITAANKMFGGEMSGAAPGAQLVSVRVCLFVSGCTSYALIEGMIYAAKNARADVINMSIGGLPALNDGNNARAELYDRLIDRYHVQMFISAGNSGPGLNTIGDPSVATKVVSVGSYISKDTWQKNYGSDSTFQDNLHPFSSRGPREDGGFKPNIVAPGSAISTTPTWQAGGSVAGTYTLPPGYSMFNGTSMASPQAAGAAALIVSAAKQLDIDHKPAQLRMAFTDSSRFLERYGAYEQGNGLMNVGKAWELVKKWPDVTSWTSSAPVNTVLSSFLKVPNTGPGINQREGWKVGDERDLSIKVKRESGHNDRFYKLSWVGNDGTFSLNTSPTRFPRGEEINVSVKVKPTTPGAHSAILNIDDPDTVGIDYQIMNVVVAAEQLATAPGGSITKTGTIGRNQVQQFFFNVPIGTPAFKVDLDDGDSNLATNFGPGKGQVRFLRFDPLGVPIESTASTSCYAPPVASCAGGTPNSRTVINPLAGVWEVTVEARRTSDTENAPYTLTASLLGASVTPNPLVIPSATIGTPITQNVTLTNKFGAFTGRATGSTLGSARKGVFSIANLAQQVYDVTVTPGSTSFRATIGGTSDAAADLDLLVYNCTTGTCVLAGQSADGDSEESVTIANPAAGLWRVLVDGYAVPAGTTTYNYTDVFVNATFGSIAITDANALRPAGAVWTVPAVITVGAAPAAGRKLLGSIEVRTDTNILVGSGEVLIESVTP